MNEKLNPQPPTIQGGPKAKEELNYVADGSGDEDYGDPQDWMDRARSAYYASTSYFDSNYRKRIEDGIRLFNSQHTLDSKYNSNAFAKRSSLFRPKTRAIIRKNEAAASAAFFSNMDVISCEAENQSDEKQRISADVMRQLLQYRLTKSVPWFQIVLGGLQDAQKQMACVAHIYWDFKEKKGQIVSDKPCIDLIPIENIRVDPGSSWTDPINTSPYVIHLMPMYVGEIKQRMTVPDKRGKKWRTFSDGVIRTATMNSGDSTRQARSKAEDQYGNDSRDVGDYEIAWVQRHIHRVNGRDFHFYTLADIAMLTEPEPLEEVVFHGVRPYVMGFANLETHTPLPSSVSELGKGLQDEANEIVNQRLDNVKFVLNKGYRVKRGKNVDIAALVRNAPGKIVMVDDPANDIVEENWQDVTASSYEEQNRINQDMDELLGNFNPATQGSSRAGETVRGMVIATQPANMLTEYLLQTYVHTFIEPILRHLVKLEQAYETDQVVMTIAAAQSQVWQKYGQDQVTDDILDGEMTIKVNVGMGATDPASKLQRFAGGVQAYTNIAAMTAKVPALGLNLTEVGKEIFAHLGYQDGKRFFQKNDPQVAQLQAQLQQMQQLVQMASMKVKDKTEDRTTKLQIAREKNVKDVIVQKMKHGHESRMKIADVIVNANKPQPKAVNGKSKPN